MTFARDERQHVTKRLVVHTLHYKEIAHIIEKFLLLFEKHIYHQKYSCLSAGLLVNYFQTSLENIDLSPNSQLHEMHFANLWKVHKLVAIFS